MLVKKVKCNFRVMGKKFGKMMKAVADAVSQLTQEQIAELEQNGALPVNVDGNTVDIVLEDVEIISEDIPGWTVAVEGSITVALDINVTPELRSEGVAREIVKRIQAIRKESGLEITDRVNVTITDIPQIAQSVSTHSEYISAQVLANSITLGTPSDGQEVDFDEFKAVISVVKA